MLNFAAMALVVALASSSDVATPGAAAVRAATPAKTAAAPDPLDRVVCRPIIPTGTRLPSGHLCQTQRDWNQLTSDSRKALETTQMHGDMSAPKGG